MPFNLNTNHNNKSNNNKFFDEGSRPNRKPPHHAPSQLDFKQQKFLLDFYCTTKDIRNSQRFS